MADAEAAKQLGASTDIDSVFDGGRAAIAFPFHRLQRTVRRMESSLPFRNLISARCTEFTSLPLLVG